MDLTRLRFGKLTVDKQVWVEREKWDIVRNRMWRCKCDCGEVRDFLENNLLSGRTKSCGCARSAKALDLKEKRFGRLVVKRQVESRNGMRRWWAKCDCGNDIEVLQASLTRGRTQSCGCLQKEAASSVAKNCFKHKAKEDLTGKRFGSLLVTHRSERKTNNRAPIWVTKCDCGNVHEVRSDNLKSGKAKSCGCSKKKKSPLGNQVKEN